jgi:hypothetical protein
MAGLQKNHSVKLYNKELLAMDVLVQMGMFAGRSHAMRECALAFVEVCEALCMDKDDPQNFTRINVLIDRISKNRDQLKQSDLFDKDEGITFEQVETMRKALN